MAINLISNTGAGSTNGLAVTTSAIDTTGANFIIVVIAGNGNISAATLSDSKSNTWSTVTESNTGTSRAQLFYAFNPIVGTGHTFSTNSVASNFVSLCVASFSGVTATAFDTQSHFEGDGSDTSIQPGSITPFGSDQLIVSALGDFTTDTISIDSSFTITDQIPSQFAVRYGCALAYLAQTGQSAVNPTWSWANDALATTTIATFKIPFIYPQLERSIRGINRGLIVGAN